MLTEIRQVLPALFLFCLTLQAQIGGGSIVGVVKDPSGAPVARVKVLAHHQETK